MRNSILIIVLTFIGFAIVAMPTDSTDKETAFPVKLPFKKQVKYADANFELGNFFEALELYKELSVNKPDDDYFNYQIAECYNDARDYSNAAKYYRKVAGFSDKYPMLRFNLAEMQQKQGLYEDAKKNYGRFIRQDSKEALANKEIAKKRMESCEYALAAAQNTDGFEVTHLGPIINQPWTEFAPRMFDENTLYYSSLNDDSLSNKRFLKYGMYLTHIYKSTRLEDGTWDKGVILDRPVNSDVIHTGNTAFSKDGQRMYLTQCIDNGASDIECKIYVSKNRNGSWSTPKALNAQVNAPGSNNTHPAVTESEKGKDLLYFVSNREGGKGKYDIYYTQVNSNGAVSGVTNLEAVNTIDNEYTPFYDDIRKRLYFSSEGRLGFGGYDIYDIKGNPTDGWGDVNNLGTPVNSSADDMYFATGEVKRTYYMVSNRPGIIGLKSETCCDDIFKVKDLFKPLFAVSGDIRETEDSVITDKFLAGVKVQIFDVTDGEKELVDEFAANDINSRYLYDKLKVDKKYTVRFHKDGYFAKVEDISTMNLEDPDTFNINVGLEKIRKDVAYTLQNIYYAYKSAELTEESKVALDDLYKLMVDNSSIIIELSAHTDSIGSNGYNMRLSQKRAESCVNYLVDIKEIPIERIIARGYGETKPVAPNSSLTGGDSPEGRAKNRRTEYRVVGELEHSDDQIIYKQ